MQIDSMSQLDAAALAERLGAAWDGARYFALCPVHEDHNPSLSFTDGDKGVLLHCFACTASGISPAAYLQQFCEAMHIVPQQLFFNGATPQDGRQEERKIPVAEYDYTAADGTLLFQVVRYEPKGFSQRRPNGNGGWIPGLNGVPRVLYRLPELIAGVEAGDIIYIVEGEKDVDNLHALGLVATTTSTSCGASGKWVATYNEYFRGAQVVILPDNDGPGQQHAQKVATALDGTAVSIQVVMLPGLPEKGDVSDWLTMPGNTRAKLEQLVRETPVWTPPAAPEAVVQTVDLLRYGA